MDNDPKLLSITTPKGYSVSYFSLNETLWFSGKETAGLFGYKQTRNIIANRVSQKNKKSLKDCGVSFSGFPPNSIFITLEGVHQMFNVKENDPLSSEWSSFFNVLQGSVEPSENVSENLFLDQSTGSKENLAFFEPVKFQQLSDIPETLSVSLRSQGFVYLLRWESLGKVGKTRSMRNRKQALLQKFKEGELIWFCFCQNIDILEREILEKLSQLGALVKHEKSVEVFNPTIISFEEVQREITRLAKKINSEYTNDENRISLKQESLQMIVKVIDFVTPLSNTYPKESIDLVKKVVSLVENLETKTSENLF